MPDATPRHRHPCLVVRIWNVLPGRCWWRDVRFRALPSDEFRAKWPLPGYAAAPVSSATCGITLLASSRVECSHAALFSDWS